jgi:hypothetical protein
MTLASQNHAGPQRDLRRRAVVLAVTAVVAVLPLGVATAAQGSARLPHPIVFGESSTAPPGPSEPAPVTGTTGVGGMVLSASFDQPGYIGLSVTGASGATVQLSELTSTAPTGAPIGALTPVGGAATLNHAAELSCAQTTRTFEASETDSAGTAESSVVVVTTPSCATGLSASLPTTRLHRDHPLDVAISDIWRIGGLTVDVCLNPATDRPCAKATFTAGQASATVRFRLGRRSHPLIVLSDPYQTIDLHPHVLPSRPVLLATGDSEMQVLDDDLATDLAGRGGARVIGDARQSTAISTPFFFNWPAHAFAQVEDEHPDIVAMFMGGNEGFPLSGVDCCGRAYSRQYALKVEGMMRTYLQHGKATVYWFLIPTPSKPEFVRLVDAVNRGIEIAAKAFPSGVHVFNLRPVFSPGGRYIDSLTYRGQTITVHEADGYHLSASADVIVAHLLLARLRHDGLIS